MPMPLEVRAAQAGYPAGALAPACDQATATRRSSSASGKPQPDLVSCEQWKSQMLHMRMYGIFLASSEFRSITQATSPPRYHPHP
eukprot:1158815-Pelagomonas_calceolata.AAC.11